MKSPCRVVWMCMYSVLSLIGNHPLTMDFRTASSTWIYQNYKKLINPYQLSNDRAFKSLGVIKEIHYNLHEPPIQCSKNHLLKRNYEPWDFTIIHIQLQHRFQLTVLSSFTCIQIFLASSSIHPSRLSSHTGSHILITIRQYIFSQPQRTISAVCLYLITFYQLISQHQPPHRIKPPHTHLHQPSPHIPFLHQRKLDPQIHPSPMSSPSSMSHSSLFTLSRPKPALLKNILPTIPKRFFFRPKISAMQHTRLYSVLVVARLLNVYIRYAQVLVGYRNGDGPVGVLRGVRVVCGLEEADACCYPIKQNLAYVFIRMVKKGEGSR